VPYAAGEKKWDYQQIGGFSAGAMRTALLRAARAYNDPKYAALASKLGGEHEGVDTLLLRDALPGSH
jgi:hypothetical protein